MPSLFNYNSIKCTLEKETRTLEVQIPSNFSTEFIFELESLASWCADKIEISSILFTPQKEFFPSDFSKEDKQEFKEEKLEKLINKLREITFSFFHLPQTIIMDIKSGCQGMGAEFALGGDIRIGLFRSQIHWNHLSKGYSPMVGGSTLLPYLIGRAKAQSWILSAKKISASEGLETGYLSLTYQVPSETKYLLRNIHAQSQVARIQTKRAFLETLKPVLEAGKIIEEKICAASLKTHDYKASPNSSTGKLDFTSPIEFQAKLISESSTRSAELS